MTTTHVEHEDEPWTINIGDHPTRADSPLYLRSRASMILAVKLVQPWFMGDPPYQDHHGGGIWVKDASGWLLVKNVAGIEWSAQFCADPAKVDAIRRNAERIVATFSLTESAYLSELGMTVADLAILHAPITDAAGIAAWTDSFWNASVPLPQCVHTGVIGGTCPQVGGVHHYPTPITDIELIKHDDFTLWVIEPSTGRPLAVTPLAPRGSGNAGTVVAWAHPQAHVCEGAILPATHPVSCAAFAFQLQDKGDVHDQS